MTGIDLRALFEAGVEAVTGDTAVRRALEDFPSEGQVRLVALGKAAHAMCRGAREALGDRIESALVVTKYGHGHPEIEGDARFECLEAAHPTPDEASLRAGRAVGDAVASTPRELHLLVLISGGTSALVEDLIDGVELSDLRQVTERLLANGVPIGEMNRVRRELSRIKGGKLARRLTGGEGDRATEVWQWLISDVPGDRPGDIGSGPLVPPDDAEPGETARRWLDDTWLQRRVDAPTADDPVWQRVHTAICASSTRAQAAVASTATDAGWPVVQASGSLDGDVEAVADRILARVTAADAARGLYIWGGEPTVTLPENPGRGGRNQHLALMLGRRLHALGIGGWSLLVGGTDGSDGPTDDAGGWLDPDVMAQAAERGLDAEASLAAADAGTWLEAAGGLVTTGPTGTNVMDLAILWRDPTAEDSTRH